MHYLGRTVVWTARRLALRSLIGVGAVVALGMPFAARAEEKKPDPTAMEEVLDILLKDGTIDSATRERLLAKQLAQDKKQSDVATGVAGFEWFGDLRLRYEAFRFSSDELRGQAGADDRSRERFRARLGFRKKLNDRVTVGVRLASGNSGTAGDFRSTNVSFGEGNNDRFSPDGIFIDQAWLDVKAADSDTFKLGFTAGKVANPYVGKVGLTDLIIFDSDITPEGLYVSTSFRPSEPVNLYGTLGGFIIDEDTNTKDPKLVGLQLGGTVAASESLSLGLRGSLYEFRALDNEFIANSINSGSASNGGSGNTAGAFGEDPASGMTSFDGRARVGELFAFATLSQSEMFPVTLYGTFIQNFAADSNQFVTGGSTRKIGKNDLATGIGIEVGNSKKSVLVGLAYLRVEANSVVATFTDSDLLDGITNREGFAFYLGREIVKNVDFRLSYYDSKEIRDGLLGDPLLATAANQPLGASLLNADRRRLQADIAVKF